MRVSFHSMHSLVELSDQRVPRDSVFARAWKRLHRQTDNVDLLIVGTALVQIASTWISGLPYILADCLYPPLLSRWKIQPRARQTRAALKDVFFHLIAQHMTLLIGSTLLSASIKHFDIQWAKQAAHKSLSAPLTSFQSHVKEMFVNVLAWEAMFYGSHRILHGKLFYRLIHKKHHTFKAPISLCSNYALNIEHIAGNLLPGLTGPVINHIRHDSHLVSHWLWFAFGAWLTNATHSGYAVPFNPFLPCTLAHEYHHLTFYHQLGTFGFMDQVWKTHGGKDYKRWKAEVADRIFHNMPLHKAFVKLF